MVLGSCLKIRDVCMVFEAYCKVHSLVSVHPKRIILGEMINLDMIFHVVVSVYRLVKIWNSSQFPDEFRNSQLDLFLAGAVMSGTGINGLETTISVKGTVLSLNPLVHISWHLNSSTAALRKYQEINSDLPERIIIYRDGVGDGQLKLVVEHEVAQLKASFQEISSGYK